ITLTNNGSNSNSFAGIIQNGAGGALSLTIAGTGTFTLPTGTTYTGSTTVTGGSTLNLNASTVSSAFAVQNGTLNLGTPLTYSPSPSLTLGDASNHSGLVELNGNAATLSSLSTVGTGGSNILRNTNPSTSLVNVVGGNSTF